MYKKLFSKVLFPSNMKNLKLLLIHRSLANWLSIYVIILYMLSCNRSLPRCPEQQHGNTLLEVLNSNTLVTSIEPIDGWYCWLLCITICIRLSTTESNEDLLPEKVGHKLLLHVSSNTAAQYIISNFLCWMRWINWLHLENKLVLHW
jgi:hypothetical protein